MANQNAGQMTAQRKTEAGKQKLLGTVLTVISATGFGLMVIFAKLAYRENLNILTVLSLRFLIAALIMWMVVFAGKKNPWIGLNRILAIMALGGIGYGLETTLLFGSIRLIPASIASILLFTYPVIVTVLSAWIFREKFTLRKMRSLGMSSVGLIMVVGIALEGLNLTGALLSLGAAVAYSLYLISGNKLLSENEPLVMTTYIITAAALVFNAVGWATGSISLPDSTLGWLSIAGIAVFSTAVSILTLFQAMRLIGPSRFSIISTIEPVITVGAAYLLLAEQLSLIQIAGGGLVILAVILLQIEKESK